MKLPDNNRDHVLGLFRIVIGFLYACHGAAALFGVPGGGHGAPPAVGEWPGWWANVIALVGGALVMAGAAPRGAAVVCSGAMAYAYFTVHQPHALFPLQNGGEKAALFCWSFLLIAVLGPGRWAVADLVRRRPRRTAGAGQPAPDGVAAPSGCGRSSSAKT
jgi:putative oxidoreductase